MAGRDLFRLDEHGDADEQIMPGTVSPFPGRSSRSVFYGRRLIGLSRRGIALAVVASLLVYLIACTIVAIDFPGAASEAAETSVHHVHPEGAPEQVECCSILQETSMSARHKNLLPFFLVCCFRFKPSARLGLARPPADTAGPPGRPHLASTLRPRAPPR